MGKSRASERGERLARALRANLKRRKAAPRATAETGRAPQPETATAESLPRDALSPRNPTR
ncbi:MAG: hypothetical protein ACREHV_07050 [Rhizomicrobium sp.]